MFQWQRTHIIDELERHKIEIETFNPLLYSNVEEANEKVVEVVSNGNYDLFMSNTGYYKMLFVDTLERIKKMGVPTFTISWDNLMAPYLDEILAPHFDLMWLTAKETIKLYKNWGANYFFAPYAANPFTYSYSSLPINRTVCFIGTPHGSRSKMINTLTQAGIQVDLYYGRDSHNKEQSDPIIPIKYSIIHPSVYESNFKRLFFAEGRKLLLGSIVNRIKGYTQIDENDKLSRHFGLPHSEMVKTYSSAALSLASTSASHTDALSVPLRIINLRNFEIPMCGGIELCKYSEELANYFEEGKEILFYKDSCELIDKANYYLNRASEQELVGIKQAARKRAEAEHTWWKRFTKAFDILGLRYEK